MTQSSWWAFAVILALGPPSVAGVLFVHRTLPERLVFFFVTGLMVSHWMHVWCYRLQDLGAHDQPHTKMNVLFAVTVDWKVSLATGVLLFLVLYALFRTVWSPSVEIRFSTLSLVALAALIASQIAASSIPKLAIDVGLLAVFLLGLVTWRYFLTYADSAGAGPAQLQSDALTTFGLMISFLALWVPSAVGFGSFLHSYYRQDPNVTPLGVQLQMTRYAVGVAYSLLGFGLVMLEALHLLIRARSGGTS